MTGGGRIGRRRVGQARERCDLLAQARAHIIFSTRAQPLRRDKIYSTLSKGLPAPPRTRQTVHRGPVNHQHTSRHTSAHPLTQPTNRTQRSQALSPVRSTRALQLLVTDSRHHRGIQPPFLLTTRITPRLYAIHLHMHISALSSHIPKLIAEARSRG